MHRLFARTSSCVALIVGSLLTGGVAHAEPAPMVKIVLESFIAYDLEESGHDEIYVNTQHGGKNRNIFPTNSHDLSVARDDCVYISGNGCPPGTNSRGYYYAYQPIYPANGTLMMITLYEDDISGDDALLNVPLWPQPISENQYFHEDADMNGHHYVLNFRLEPFYS
ncbi:hypothetical protein ACQPYK_05510 [Streptosporangium sp. CA-135522]|uniref:hypothetical protein n=1 Tax=Streptosporangium sp. CA-135522 TaxID=3240072 RepID=UPI003D915355